jgi:hypothetical protein
LRFDLDELPDGGARKSGKTSYPRSWLYYFTATGVAQVPLDTWADRPFGDSVKTALSGQPLTITSVIKTTTAIALGLLTQFPPFLRAHRRFSLLVDVTFSEQRIDTENWS